MLSKLLPFLTWFQLVNFNTLKADFLAGLTGAVIVLPQGVAFAAIAGLPPEYGLYTAMVTPIIAALFGSSFHLISGPTTAISIVVFSAISHHAQPGTPEFVSLVLTLTFLAGVYQLVFGLARLGSLVNFVSHTVIIGFTAGAAILIATSQIKHVVGVPVPNGESFIQIWSYIIRQLGDINGYVFGIAITTLIVAVLAKRFWPRSPNLLLGMIAGSVLCYVLEGASHGVTLVGEIPAHLPPLSMPDFSLSVIRQLAPEAFAVALLGLIEAVSISRSIAAKSHQRIDASQEFVGQGLSNIVGSFVSSYAGSGSFSRSGINYASGAKTPLSAIFAAVSLMLIVILIAPLMAYLPIAAMGGIILVVAYQLVDFPHIKKILRVSKSETSILLVTFCATLFLDLEFAIYMGVFLSLIIFLSRTSMPNIVTLAPDPESINRQLKNVVRQPLTQCPQLKIIRIDMSVYFGSINHVQAKLHEITDKHGAVHILLIGHSINFIDIAGGEMLIHEAGRLKRKGGGLYFCGMKSKVGEFMSKGDFIKEIGRENFFDTKDNAIRIITSRLDHNICQQCTAKVFKECDALSKRDG
ncbi:MAG: SulP family inorganic anion transporter [Gammaproteobacteria bacterium]|nr:SulP family inorganic anion transporter [Gammaproteobacteria bacterium]